MQPMLASQHDPKYPIRFPVLASPKIDGIRGYVKNGALLSRSGKPIRNQYVQSILGKGVLDGLDGELAVGNPWDKDLMQKTNSGVMSASGEPDFCYWVFDIWASRFPYKDRYRLLNINSVTSSYIKEIYEKKILHFLEHVWIKDQLELDLYESSCLSLGYEGIMIRDPNGPYKYGRSTAKEGWLLKVKRWSDGEAVIVDFQEKLHNANEMIRDVYGRAERSSHQENKIPMGTLGALICTDITTGAQIKIGTGFDDAMRKSIWDQRFSLLNSIVKYKHFAQTGVKDTSRFPVFIGFRDKEDM
jgi:DNA ligase-1